VQVEINKDSRLRVSTVIENVGEYPCGQTLQVYVKALREGTPNAQLKGLKKIFLQPGEAKEVSVVLGAEAFALYDEDAKFVVEAGEYEICIGMQQPDARSEQLTGQKVTKYKVASQETFVL
jgi:beta-glucosidase